MAIEFVDIDTIAERTGYSKKYFHNKWPELLPGVKPIKLGPNRAIRFDWNKVVSFMLQPK